LVMAPNKPQVVSFNALTVRSGSALPSLHQNSQPMSHGTYSASSFKRSNTRRAASITSWPTPSPGIHAILYLAMVATLSTSFTARKLSGCSGGLLPPDPILGSARASRVAFGASPNACFYSQKRNGNVSFAHGKIENTKMKVRLGEGAETSTRGACSPQKSKIMRFASHAADWPPRSERHLYAGDHFVELIVAKLRVRFAEIRPGVDVIEHQLDGITMNVVIQSAGNRLNVIVVYLVWLQGFPF